MQSLTAEYLHCQSNGNMLHNLLAAEYIYFEFSGLFLCDILSAVVRQCHP